MLLTVTLLVAAAARPNVVFVMTDDHAAHAVSAYGSRVNQTPSLDRLAREGMLFGNAFVTNSICTPSRAAILTGLYSHKNGVPVFNRFDGSQPTLPKLLQAAGYHTGMIGKWHLGSDPTGFDRWEILPGQGAYLDPILYTATGEKTYAGRYATDVITDLGIDFIRERPKDRPFFLMLHHKAPHRSWTPDERHRRMFESRVIPEPPTLWDGYETRTDALRENRQRVADDLTRRDLKLEPPAELSAEDRFAWLSVKPTEVEVVRDGKAVTLTGDALARYKYQRYMQDYLACVQSVDDNVGRLLDFLKQSGLERDTIVVYTSDQGFFLGDHGLYDKRFMYEESLRIPLLVRWPAVVRPGSRTEGLALNVDFAPTFLEAAGAAVPGRDAGPEPAAAAARRGSRHVARRHLLPLLPRPRPPRHARPLRRAHPKPQAHLLLDETAVGALRPARGPAGAQEPLRPAGAGGRHGRAPGDARAPARRAAGRRPLRERAAARRGGRDRRAAARPLARRRASVSGPM